MSALQGLTLFITGGTRGIGRAIALRLAREGVNIVLAAKTDTPHPHLPGTLDSVCAEVKALGGQALGIKADVRQPEQIEAAMLQAAEHFGHLDIVINNAGAIHLAGLEGTSLKQFDLMQSVNERASFIVAQAALPYLKVSRHPHLLSLSPPLNLSPAWLGRFAPYTLSKYGMTLLMLGLAEEFRGYGIACNTLWPRTYIATSATERFAGESVRGVSRTPDIMADAVLALLQMQPVPTGKSWLDEELLKLSGVEDFSPYTFPGSQDDALQLDFYVDA